MQQVLCRIEKTARTAVNLQLHTYIIHMEMVTAGAITGVQNLPCKPHLPLLAYQENSIGAAHSTIAPIRCVIFINLPALAR